MEISWVITSVLIGLVVFVIPVMIGTSRCVRFLLGHRNSVNLQDTYSRHYEMVLDMTKPARRVKSNVKKWDYAEVISLGIAPIMGIGLSLAIEGFRIPFDPSYAISPITFILVGYISYWLSRRFRHNLSVNMNLFLPYGIIIGILSYLMLFIHFFDINTLIAMGFASVLAFPLLAPLPACIYALRQLKIQNEYLKEITENEAYPTPAWIKNFRWNNTILNVGYLLGFIMIIQVILLGTGQPLDGFWQAFEGSSDFLFSSRNDFF